MTIRVTRSISVRRPHCDVASFVTDPHRFLPVIPGFGRFRFVEPGPEEGEELWDVFLEVGTLHVGGRVVVSRPSVNRLEWVSHRGARHGFSVNVEPVGDQARLTMTLEYHFDGFLTGRVTELLGRGIAVRHLEAGLQEVRHLLEYGDLVELS